MISVIVPIRGEVPPAAAFIEAIRSAPDVELIVAAEPSTGTETLEAYRVHGARLLVCDAPRGERLSRAAAEAQGEILLFLHADTLLPEGWSALVNSSIDGGAVGGAFRLAFSGSVPRLKWVAWWANWRTAVTRVPYGDQAPFVSTEVYRRIGAHAAWPLMEDVELGRRLRTAGRIALLDASVLTSPRRYLEKGVVRTILTNWATLLKFRFGADPKDLAVSYRK
ncbi:MAG: glycosyltransferase family 2 protein [Thermoanaerobaculia bacterium]